MFYLMQIFKAKMKEKKYPDDYTKKEIEIVKELVIARLQQLPDNFRLSIG